MVAATLFILTVLAIGYLNRKSDQELYDEYYKKELLFEKRDEKGRVRQTVVTGRIPGEDVYLNIKRLDTLGRVVLEYGARPYGSKFKIATKYDEKGRKSEEIVYEYSGGMGTEYGNLYELSDTAEDFSSPQDQTKWTYRYHDREDLITERIYHFDHDSLTGRDEFKFSRDTTYKIEMDSLPLPGDQKAYRINPKSR